MTEHGLIDGEEGRNEVDFRRAGPKCQTFRREDRVVLRCITSVLGGCLSSSSSEPKPLMPLGKDVAWDFTTEAKLMTPVRAQGMLSDPGAHSILVPQ